ncbi:hypothetical protein BKA82DRAFT_34817 [Pisolithus tinctorius]|uniref:Kinase n=1 Tax=Pisolithus tinctorius Marx 270 TaxID=870435 RepID=A0A0C3JAE9_PISTI|nr:hypothetical protein BKA82DRAFT_34817 [Pisolithus tinctorius]KIN94651.1 hypothetical protein M404DRAFT_34817 [Pisolithus tinctorius Marx 270]
MVVKCEGQTTAELSGVESTCLTSTKRNCAVFSLSPPSFFHHCASLLPSSSNDITTPDNIQPGLPPLSLSVLLTRLLEALERLRAALAEAEVRIVGGSILIIYEGDWARAEKAVRTLAGDSDLNSKPTAAGEGLGRNEEGPLDEEDEDEEETITVEVDESGHLILDDVVATSPVVESFEENDDDDECEDEDEEDDPRLFRLSLIDFAHT